MRRPPRACSRAGASWWGGTCENLADLDVSILQHCRAADGSDACDADDAAARADASQAPSSGHLMLVRLPNGCGRPTAALRASSSGWPRPAYAANVHYKPLPHAHGLPRPRVRHRPTSRTPCAQFETEVDAAAAHACSPMTTSDEVVPGACHQRHRDALEGGGCRADVRDASESACGTW